MAYDEQLADRVRAVIALREQVSERKMFGGVAWMIAGNMACALIGGELLVRLSREDVDAALAEPLTRPADMTGKPMRGFVIVEAEAVASDEGLAGWVDAGADFAASLPAKSGRG